MKLLDLQAQHQAYRSEIDEAIQGVISSGYFIGGPVITELEKSLSEYCGAPHSIVCSSGTDALLLSLMALGVGPGDEVITTPYSFIATAEVINLLRAKTVFVDVLPDTFNINPQILAEKITPQTKAVIPVSLFGQTPDIEEIQAVCQTEGVAILEDAAQSFGANHGERKSGNLSMLGATSFFPAKPLGCYGDGGAVFTQDDSLAAKVRMLLNHGQSRQYYHDIIGINGRLDALQAAVLEVKLKYLDEEITARNKIATFYNQGINPMLFTPQKVLANRKSAYAQYCLTVVAEGSNEEVARLREKVRSHLNDKGVPTAMYYPIPIHLQKPFLELGYKLGDFPVSEKLSQTMFALPVHPFLTDADQKKVVEAVNEVGVSVLL